MELHFSGARPDDAERAAVDTALGTPPTSWTGAEERTEADLRAVYESETRPRRHMLLPVLNAVQSEIGWISRGALDYICRRLSVPPADAYGVASFYALLATDERPRRVAHICDDIGCRSSGATALIGKLSGEIGPAGSADMDRMWLSSPCLGQCDRAPAVYLQLAGEDDQTLSCTDAEAVLGALSRTSPQPPPTPMVVPQAGDPDLSLLARVGGPNSTLADYRAAGGYAALERALGMRSSDVIEEVKASRLRGRGGAAFPTGLKWEAVAGASDTERYLICNADESEPGTFKDRVLLEGAPFAVVESMTIAGITCGAEKGYIYVRAEYPTAERRLRTAVAAARADGRLGTGILGTSHSFDIEIRRGAGAYICGEETALMRSIEGHRGEPRNKPPFPTERGLFNKPTLINNVETLVNVLDIVTRGGRAYAEIGTSQSTGTRLFCLSGAVAKPGVYEVAMGTKLGDLIALAGGTPGGDPPRAILLGGAAGTFIPGSLLDLPLTFEDARDRGVTLGSGAVILFDDDTDFADVLQRIAAFFRDESCGQCVPCRVGTVRLEELLARHVVAGDDLAASLLADVAQVMRDASICGLGQTAANAIRSAIDIGLLDAP